MASSSAERELELVLEKSRDNIMITDGAGRILKAGSKCAIIYGREIEQMLGISIYDLEREGVLKPSVSAQVLRQKAPVQLMQTTETGRTVMAEGFPLFDAQGTLYRVISFSQDLTDLQLLQQEYELLQQKLQQRSVAHDAEVIQAQELTFKSAQLKELYALLQRVAPSDANLLMLGESGVGKTAFAQLAHHLSSRRGGPFIEVNCSAIPENLFESEMFGYAPGSFTGASRQGKPGLIEQAHRGTLFLDEVGDLPLAMQVKLLKVLQDGKVTRIGSTEPRVLDFRLISATNQPLQQRVESGHFRLDLYYRLNVVPVTIAPLRERPEDIAPLLERVLGKLNARYQQHKVLDSRARHQLIHYAWPGNVRELENVLERSYVASPGTVIHYDGPDPVHRAGGTAPASSLTSTQPASDLDSGGDFSSLPEALDAFERQLLQQALKRCNTTYELADYLGISQPTVFRRLRKYGLQVRKGQYEGVQGRKKP
jgi:transcriptional regulator with PAS, ATPase and Fis domain